MDLYYYRVVVYTHCQHTFQFKQLVKVHVASDDPFKFGVTFFFIWGVEGGRNVSKNIFISPKCLIMQSYRLLCNNCTIVKTKMQCTSLIFMPGSHILRLQCFILSHQVHYWSVAVYHQHNIYPLFWFQIQTLLLKMLFQHCDFFFHSTVIQ